MKTYGKWTPAEWRSYSFVFWDYAYGIQRTVTTEYYPLGFHWKRIKVERLEVPRGVDRQLIDRDRLCRVLNGEAEPSPRLDDREWLPSDSDLHTGFHFTGGPYRFSTEALRAELARREGVGQPVWMDTTTGKVSPFNRRTGPADRRKGANDAGHTCGPKGEAVETCPACKAYWRGYRQAEHNAKPAKPKRPKTRRSK